MLKVRYSALFKKDFKRIVKRGWNPKLLSDIVAILTEEKPLLPENKDHALNGKWSGFRECHITPDWLMIYRIEKSILTLSVTRTGSHSDLF